jgi:hypothetical protein
MPVADFKTYCAILDRARAVARHIFKSYDGVLKVDGEVGNKKVYDPRPYLAVAEGQWPSA